MINKATAAKILVLLTALLTIVVITVSASNKPLVDNHQPLAPSTEAPNCRLSFTPLGQSQADKLSTFDAGWYLNFSTNQYSTDAGVEFTPMIRVHQDKDSEGNYLNSYTTTPALTDAELGAKITANPDAIWMIGNEVDRGPQPGEIVGIQDDVQPDMYARIYHDAYEFIKLRDPEARISFSGLVQVTPGRLQYMDKVWDAYQAAYGENMPVDVWTFHIYMMPEVDRGTGQANGAASVAVGTDVALGKLNSDGVQSRCGDPNNDTYCFADHDNLTFFDWQVRAMRTWMKDHGQQNRPLLLSEFSLLYPETIGGDPFPDEFGQTFSPDRAAAFLHSSFTYLDSADIVDTNLGYPLDGYRMVQQSQWFSGHVTGSGYISNLYFDAALTQISPVGQALQQEMAARSAQPNLRPIQPSNPTGFIIAPATTTTVTLSTKVINNGDTAVTTPISVTFYADENMTRVIETAVIPSIYGCASVITAVSVNWADLSSGVHHYWVKVETVPNEADTTDNTASGIVIVDPQQTFLPVILRN